MPERRKKLDFLMFRHSIVEEEVGGFFFYFVVPPLLKFLRSFMTMV